MDLVLIIYLIDVIDTDVFAMFSVIAFGAAFLCFLFTRLSEDGLLEDDPDKYSRLVKPSIWAFVACCLIQTLLPSKNTMYAMLAAHGVTELAQHERVQKLGGKSLELLERTIDGHLAELDKKKEQ